MHGTAFEGEALSILVPTTQGPLGIEPGYTNFIGAIAKAGVLKVVTADRTRYFAIFGGVVDVRKGERVDIYSEEVNDGFDIDLARAIAARDRNLDRISKREEGIDIIRAKAKLAKALVRISVKELSEGRQ